LLNFLSRILEKLSILFGIVGICASMFMMLLITADVFLRYFLGRPIEGAFEITQFMLVIIFFFGFAYTQNQKSHISVDILTSKLSPKTNAVLLSFSYSIYFAFILLIAWQTFLYGMEALYTGQKTPSLEVHVSPFIFLAGFGAVIFCAVVLLDLLKNIARAMKK